MIPIILRNNQIALIDDIDADLVSDITWTMHDGYLAKLIVKNDRRVLVLLHRLILERKLGRPIRDGFVTDHINQNRCDNRRDNLREATYQENWENQARKPIGYTRKMHNPSGYKGVVYDPNPKIKIKKWKATLHCRGRAIYLGHYETKEQASVAYKDGVIKYRINLEPLPPITKKLKSDDTMM